MEYKKVYLFGQWWDGEAIERIENQVKILNNEVENLRIVCAMEEVLCQVREEYRKANNPPTDEETVLEWKL